MSHIHKSCIWHESFIFELLSVSDITRSYYRVTSHIHVTHPQVTCIWHESFKFELLLLSHVTQSYNGVTSHIYVLHPQVTCIIHTWIIISESRYTFMITESHYTFMSHIHKWHASFIFELLLVSHVTRSYYWVTSHIHVTHPQVMHLTWIIHICAMTHWCESRYTLRVRRLIYFCATTL